RLRLILLGDDRHAPARRDLQRERKARDAAAEDEVVELFHELFNRKEHKEGNVAQASLPAGSRSIPASCFERGAGMLPEPARWKRALRTPLCNLCVLCGSK